MEILGIYIPTHNRSKELKECINSFLPQIKKYKIPLYISDNGSTDNTEEMVLKMKKRYNKIYYKNTGKNLGYACNVVNVLKMGCTEFVWLFGDDDVINKGAIKTIISNLNNGYDFLQINATLYDSKLKHKIKNRIITSHHNVKYNIGDHDKVLLNAKSDGFIGYMGGIITRKILLDKELLKLNKDKITEMDFIHITLFFNSIKNKKGKLLATPIIKYRSGNGHFKETAIEIWFKKYPEAINNLGSPYSPKILKQIVNNHNLPIFVFFHKLYFSQLSKQNRQIILENKNITFLDKALSICILKTPQLFIELSYKLFRKRP